MELTSKLVEAAASLGGVPEMSLDTQLDLGITGRSRLKKQTNKSKAHTILKRENCKRNQKNEI